MDAKTAVRLWRERGGDPARVSVPALAEALGVSEREAAELLAERPARTPAWPYAIAVAGIALAAFAWRPRPFAPVAYLEGDRGEYRPVPLPVSAEEAADRIELAVRPPAAPERTDPAAYRAAKAGDWTAEPFAGRLLEVHLTDRFEAKANLPVYAGSDPRVRQMARVERRRRIVGALRR